MSVTNLTSSSASLAAMSAQSYDCKSNSVLSTLTAPVVSETTINSAEEKIRVLAQKIVGSIKKDDSLEILLYRANEALIGAEVRITYKGRLIMVDQNLRIFEDNYRLWVEYNDNKDEPDYDIVSKKNSVPDMIVQIQSIVAKAQAKFAQDSANKPVFHGELFEKALNGEDPTIVAFNKSLKDNPKFRDLIEKEELFRSTMRW
jgi:hypothetical protein